MSGIQGQTILTAFESRSEQLANELSELVAFDSPTGEVELIDAIANFYATRLEKAGLACQSISSDRGTHLLAERPGKSPAIVLVGHVDTVWPRGEPERRPASIEDGKLSGPGTFDMKAGLCQIASALEFIAEHRPDYERQIIVAISADEEKGSDTARQVLYPLISTDGTALVPEPPCPDGSLKIARKGVGLFELEVLGREVHAGVEPEKGISAISEVARLIPEIESWRDASRGMLVNVGTIRGGTATNVVAGAATIGVDFRFDRMSDGEELEAKLRSLRPEHSEAQIRVSGELAFPPLEPTDKSRALARHMVDIAEKEFGLTLGLGRSGGGSDGSLLASMGLTVLDGLGVDGDGAHALHEHVRVDRLAIRAALFTRIVLELESFPELR